MNFYEIEPIYYSTKLYDTETEAWNDLMAYLKPMVDDHWVWFRVIPEVNSEYLYDQKKTVYQGFARFIVHPKALGMNSDTIPIPSLGAL